MTTEERENALELLATLEAYPSSSKTPDAP